MTNCNAGSFTSVVLEGFLMKGITLSGLLIVYVNHPLSPGKLNSRILFGLFYYSYLL